MTCPLVLEHPFSINTNNAAVNNMYGNNHYNAASSNDDDDDGTTWATDKIRRMGYYHVLEQTHVVLPTMHTNTADLETLLQCINDALRALGCHVASYDANSCGATVQAVGGVEFQVVVWQKQQQQLVVELQRLAGNAYTFQVGYAKRLLEHVVHQGFLHGTPASPQHHHHRMPADNNHQNNNHTTTIAHAMDTLHKQAIVDGKHHDSNDDVVAETLEFVRRCLFDEANNDTQQVQLGLETLVDVTNPNLAGFEMAQAAATAIRASSVWTEALTQLVDKHKTAPHLAMLAWQGLHALQRNHHHTMMMMGGAAQ